MSVQLQAVVSLNHSAFTSGLSSISQAVSNVTGAMTMAFGGVASEIFAMSRAFGPVGAAVATMKEAVNVGLNFEQQMANVSSVSGLMGEELKRVEVATRDLAKTTRFTATETADALFSLATAGLTGADSLIDALGPALLLAGATLSDTGMATEAVTAAMANFQIPASDAMRIADQFAGAVARSPATMQRLADAMKYAGPAAAGFGTSLEQTVAEVAAFHQVGLRGEMAGTSFRMALVQLSKAADKTGTEIGKALDGWSAASEGVTGAVRRLNDAGIDSVDVINTLGARAGPGIAALMKYGADAMDDLAQRIQGAADVSKMYETQLNTLSGRFDIFRSALEEVSMKIFYALVPAMIDLVKNATVAVDWVGKLMDALIAGNWQEAGEQVKALGAKIITEIKGAVEVAREYAGKLADMFRDMDWDNAFDTLRTNAVDVFDRVWDVARDAIDRVTAFLRGQDWSAVWDSVRSGFITAVNFWYEHLANVWGEIATFLKGIDGAELWAAVKAGAIKAWDEIQSIAQEILPNIQQYAMNLWNATASGAMVAVEAVQSAWGSVDWQSVFARIETAISSTFMQMRSIAVGWIDSLISIITSFNWRSLGESVATTFITMRDNFVEIFHNLISSGIIEKTFQKIGEIFGTVMKSEFALLSGYLGTAIHEMTTADYWKKLWNFIVDVFKGIFQEVRGYVVGVLEGLFGKNVVDKVVAGAMLMMLEIKLAIQSKIGEILMAFNTLMAGIITKTSEGAARVAQVFGFEGMSEKIREKSKEFAAAFGEGTNGMVEAAKRTEREIKALHQCIVDLNAPVEEMSAKMQKVSDGTEEVAESVDKTADAIQSVGNAIEIASGAVDEYKTAVSGVGEATSDAADNMGQIAPAAAGVTQELDSATKSISNTADAMENMAKQADIAKKDTSKLVDEVAKFKDKAVTVFDVSNFTGSLKLLSQSLKDFQVDLPTIKLPDFSSFKIPKISPFAVSEFVNGLKLFATKMEDVDSEVFATKLPDFSKFEIPKISNRDTKNFIAALSTLAEKLPGLKLDEIKIPDMKKLMFQLPKISNMDVQNFLSVLQNLKNGLMQIDFGALGGINIDIKGGGASDAVERLDKILNFMESKNGILWA